jgi:hypothetical protein
MDSPSKQRFSRKQQQTVGTPSTARPDVVKCKFYNDFFPVNKNHKVPIGTNASRLDVSIQFVEELIQSLKSASHLRLQKLQPINETESPLVKTH